jgi:hypothetical protein
MGRKIESNTEEERCKRSESKIGEENQEQY